MSTSTAATIVTTNLGLLQGYIVQAFTSIAGIVIAVMVLFALVHVLKGLWHRKV